MKKQFKTMSKSSTLQTRLKEHKKNSGPVNNHITSCAANVTEENVAILAATSQGKYHHAEGPMDSRIGARDEHQGWIQEQDTDNRIQLLLASANHYTS